MGITNDADRPLTPRGVEQARAVGEAFTRRGLRLDGVVSSPLMRARQTAEEMLRGWPTSLPELQISAHLVPGGKRRKLARKIAALGKEALALVGHQPHLGELAAWLIGSRDAQIEIAKAGVAYLRSDGAPEKGSCTLLWLLTPEWMQKA